MFITIFGHPEQSIIDFKIFYSSEIAETRTLTLLLISFRLITNFSGTIINFYRYRLKIAHEDQF